MAIAKKNRKAIFLLTVFLASGMNANGIRHIHQ
jgi:hypothetical protein